MNPTIIIITVGALAIGFMIYIVIKSLVAGKGDIRYFEKTPLSHFQQTAEVFKELNHAEFDFFGVHPIAEWSQTELSFVVEGGAEIAHYTRPSVGLKAQLNALNKSFEIHYPKYDIGTHLKDSHGNNIATVRLASMGSSDAIVEFPDGSHLKVSPYGSQKSLFYKTNAMEWINQANKPFALSFHVHAQRRSNVYVLAIHKDSTELQRLCVFAFFTT